MWWIIVPLVALLVAKAKSNTTVAASTAGATAAVAASQLVPTEQVSSPSNPVPPQNASTVTDAQDNLAIAFHAYSTLLRNRLAVRGGGLGLPVTQPGSGGGFGGGGAGGGHGSVGCPMVGTEISPLGAENFDSNTFKADKWITLIAGEFLLHATPSHLIYTDKGILSLSEAKTGMRIVTNKGEREIQTLTEMSGEASFLKIHVPSSHLFFAGGILSHNKA